MRIAVPLAFAGLCLAAPAGAATVLDLSNVATVSVQPDELGATLRAEAGAPTAAAAQEAVNRAIAQALAAAKAVAGVRAETGQYSVWTTPPAHEGGPPGAWRASQSLDLRGGDGAAMLGLVGRLQRQGLAVEQLGWHLSAEADRGAHEAALRKAIMGLRGRAETIACLLGLRFGSFRTVHVGQAAPAPFPLPMRAMMAAPAAIPPSAESGPVAVSETVTAEVVLVPGAAGQPAHGPDCRSGERPPAGR